MTAVLQQLIDKQDEFEVIRDQVAAILATETANQVALATAAAKPEPNDWNLEVYIERSNAWEKFLNDQNDTTPIVNVWVDQMAFDPKASNTTQRQKTDTTINIDIYGFAISTDDGGTGHNPGDRDAALNAQRAMRLVRNILMADTNTYLQLRKRVWGRWPQNIQFFQPTIDDNPVQGVHGARLSFVVTHNEFSPQYQPETLETVAITVKRDVDGKVILEAEFTN